MHAISLRRDPKLLAFFFQCIWSLFYAASMQLCAICVPYLNLSIRLRICQGEKWVQYVLGCIEPVTGKPENWLTVTAMILCKLYCL